jgi:hypothetical protein
MWIFWPYGLASVFGRRKDEVFLQLKALLEPFGITRYYTAPMRPILRRSRARPLSRESLAYGPCRARRPNASATRYTRCQRGWCCFAACK